MAENSIDMVRRAEAEAEEAARAAAAQARQMVDDAHAEATQLVRETEDNARGKAAARLAAAHEESRKALDADMGSLDAQMGDLAEKARQNQGEAVNAVLAMLA